MVTYCSSQAQADAEAAEWLATAPGTGFNLDQAYGYQCVDLADSNAQTMFGVSWAKTLGGVNGAKQLMSTASTTYFEKIWNDANRPDLIPRPGDIIIWGGSTINEWGHVAVVKTATRDGVTVVQQDGFAPPLVWVQNPNGQGGGYYSNKPAHLATLGYYGEGTGMVSGWLRPKWAKVVYTGADRRGYGPTPAKPTTPTKKPTAGVLWMPGAVRSPQPGQVPLNTKLPRRVTWHITSDVDPGKQQPSFSGVATYLKGQGYCPHLMWDPVTGHIEQYYPADVGARALRMWNEDGARNIQIEVLFSRGAYRDGKQYWELTDTPLRGLAQIVLWLDSHGIPRTWPMGPTPALGQAGRRDLNVWNGEAGHYGHSQVPDNDHTDPGSFPDITRIPTAAAAAAGVNTQDSIGPGADPELEDIVSWYKGGRRDYEAWIERKCRDAINTLMPKIVVNVWAYKNEKVNGNRDAYAILTDLDRRMAALEQKAGK